MNDETRADDATGPVRLSGKLICSCLMDVEVIKANLPEHVRLSLQEPGCPSFKVWQTDDQLVWGIEESFIDPSAFAHHQQRTRASAWWAATAEIPRSYTITGLRSE